MDKTFRLHILSITILLLGVLFPFELFAATCTCGLEPYEGCQEVRVPDGSTRVRCRDACITEFGNKFNNDTDFSDGYDAGIVFECTQAAAAAAERAKNDTGAIEKEKEIVFATPVLNVDIPNVSFRAPTLSDGQVTSNFLGEYITGLYKYLVGISAMIAIIMMMIGGLQYTFGAANNEQMQKGKAHIRNAITGLVLLLGTYLILFTVNPNFINNKPINLEVIEEVDLEALVPDNASQGAANDPFTPLIGPPPANLPPCSTQRATWAAKEIEEVKVCVGPCHCAFTASRFLAYLGCPGVTIHDNVSWLSTALEGVGWITEPIKGADAGTVKGYGVGLTVFKDQHVGVNIGNGVSFESGGYSPKWFAIAGNKCPKNYKESVADPSACAACAKVESEAPSTGRHGTSACSGNQAWLTRNNGYWTVIVRPPVIGDATPKKGCCTNHRGTFYISSLLCSSLTAKTGNNWKEAASAADCKK